MAAQPAGEESFDAAVAPQAVEASAGLRPDQSIEEAVRCARPDRADTKGNVATFELPRRPSSKVDGVVSRPGNRPMSCFRGQASAVRPAMHLVCRMRETSPPRPNASTTGYDARYSAMIGCLDARPTSLRVRRRGRRAYGMPDPARPIDVRVSAPYQALSVWSGRGHSCEADERRDADGDRADDGEDRLPGG